MFHLKSTMQVGPRLFAAAKVIVAGALVIAGLAVAAPAQAHTLTERQAELGAAWHAGKKVGPRADYSSYRVVFCRSLYPHIVECRIGFDDRATESTNRYACTERVHVFYKAHSEIPQRTPRKFLRHVTHEC